MGKEIIFIHQEKVILKIPPDIIKWMNELKMEMVFIPLETN